VFTQTVGVEGGAIAVGEDFVALALELYFVPSRAEDFGVDGEAVAAKNLDAPGKEELLPALAGRGREAGKKRLGERHVALY
jgi:hypothetical protein